MAHWVADAIQRVGRGAVPDGITLELHFWDGSSVLVSDVHEKRWHSIVLRETWRPGGGNPKSHTFITVGFDTIKTVELKVDAEKLTDGETVSDRGIEELGLPGFVYRLLFQNNIRTVDELCSYTAPELLTMSGFGPRGLDHVQGALRKIGRTLET